MKLLILTQYFWPESFVINDLSKALRRQGHEIVVATGKPNYPAGEVFSGYRADGVQRELFDGDIEVIRVPMRPRKAGGALNLFLNYLSFAWSGAMRFPALLRGYAFDAIVVFAPSPITAAIPAIVLKRRRKVHLAIWIQDLWPESLQGTGYVSNTVALRFVGRLVRWIYGAADTLLVQSLAFTKPVSQYAPIGKIAYYPNSVDASSIEDDGTYVLAPALVQLLDTRFCVVFAGNLGTAQSVETITAAAERLLDAPDVRIVLVGSGSMSQWLAQQVASRGLDNITLVGRVPPGAMAGVYRRASCLLVTLKRQELFAYTVPSKMQAYLAAGRPIIASLAGEGARLVVEAGAGMACEPEDAERLEQCIRAMFAADARTREEMGAAGRRYFFEHFEMNRQAARLVEILGDRMNEARADHV
jgi:glycosyltransferase involved in cell wall biosynthesis